MGMPEIRHFHIAFFSLARHKLWHEQKELIFFSHYFSDANLNVQYGFHFIFLKI